MCMSGSEYDAWKRKCAREKKERETKRSAESSLIREKQHSKGDNNVEANSSTEGKYVTLPTIPPIRAFVGTNGKIIALLPGGKTEESPWNNVRCAPVASSSHPSTSSSSAPPSLLLPLPLSAPAVSPESSSIPCSASSSTYSVLPRPPSPPLQPIVHLPPASLTDICTVLQSMPTSLLLEQLQNGISIFNSTPPDLRKESNLSPDLQTYDSYKLPQPTAISKSHLLPYYQYTPYSAQSSFSIPSFSSLITCPAPQQAFGELSRDIELLLSQSIMQYSPNH